MVWLGLSGVCGGRLSGMVTTLEMVVSGQLTAAALFFLGPGYSLNPYPYSGVISRLVAATTNKGGALVLYAKEANVSCGFLFMCVKIVCLPCVDYRRTTDAQEQALLLGLTITVDFDQQLANERRVSCVRAIERSSGCIFPMPWTRHDYEIVDRKTGRLDFWFLSTIFESWRHFLLQRRWYSLGAT